MVRVRSLRIVTVRVCAEVWLITVSGKSDPGGVTTGSGRATPVPESEITSGPFVAVELTVSVADLAPRAMGVKVTLRVQFEPALTAAAQPVTTKSPGLAPLSAPAEFGSGATKASCAVPVFETIWAAGRLGLPTCTFGNDSAATVGLISGCVPVPVSVKFSATPGLGVMRKMPELVTAAVGVKRIQTVQDARAPRLKGVAPHEPPGEVMRV